MMDYRKYITINTEVRFGRPTLIGTRIAVYDVLNWLAKGMSQDEILVDYPELTIQQIRACLSYADTLGGEQAGNGSQWSHREI